MTVRAESRPAGRAQELPVCSLEGSDCVSGAPWTPVPSLVWLGLEHHFSRRAGGLDNQP